MVIDEALDLSPAAFLGAMNPVSFVNGVLDSIRKQNRRTLAALYFPIQNVAKIRFKISSAVVAPVIASIGRSAP